VPRKRIHVSQGPAPGTAYPNRCRHCDPAPCQRVCPAGAIHRDSAFGLVLVDESRCLGCALCAVVCPFDAITFYPLAGGPGEEVPVAVKCDGCVERRAGGEAPACAEVCKVGALVFGDINAMVAAGRVSEAAAAWAESGAAGLRLRDPLSGWRRWGEAQRDALSSAGQRSGGVQPFRGAESPQGGRP